MKILLLSLFCISFVFSLEFKSSEDRVNLIELYSSEGCSSCPKAEKWLGDLKDNNKVFKEFIPLSFHVTYWDFLGWEDSFAHKKNDTRQRNYSKNVWKNNSVYTPQFIINSKEYKTWFSNQSFPKFEKKYGGVLKVKKTKQNLDISFYSKEIKNKKVFLNIAVLGFDYKIDVKNGENEGKILEHDFVVLDHQIQFASIKNNKLSHKILLPDFIKEASKKALVVWLSTEEYSLIQASASYF